MNHINKGKVEQGQLLQAAAELTKALDRVADQNLPKKLAGIVKTHAKIAVGSALIPVPGADIAAAAGNIWTMYVRINQELELPFAENIIKSLASGVLTNLGGAAVGYMVIGSAFKLIPGLGSLGGAAVMSATIYGVTIASGIIYMKAVSKLLNAKNTRQVNEENLKVVVNEIMDDKESVQAILRTAKKDYGELTTTHENRCPVILLLDTSASMTGQPINELNDGLQVFKRSIEEDYLASVRVELAIITFGGSVQMPQDFVTVDNWTPRRYEAGNLTSTGEAINYALDILEDRKQTYKNNGIQYYRPWVFLITNGDPHDEWKAHSQRLKQAFNEKKLQFFAVGVGDVRMDILKQIAPDPSFPPVSLNGLDFGSMFKWLSASLSSVSHSTPGSGQVTIQQPAWGTIAT